ncbi:RNA-guided endonuclease InsQ/TnpB family protein [Pelistega suis]|uniref:RNA-guided endonuclease InsQ/TnpB family protein n=1 Tax=Pelistega suis TaxID=1631957 RepID=UPI00211CDFD9|nr:transposase [Pelistega suis]MCQ9329527.1 transposase [Pelistega suis]
MMIYKSFKFELILNNEQIRFLRKNFGCVRFISNNALAWHNKCRESGSKLRFDSRDAIRELESWKKEFPWLNEYQPQIIKEAIRDLETAFKHYYAKRLAYPRFKAKGVKDSFRVTEGFKVEQQNNRCYLPEIGWIRYINSREIKGTIRSITISYKSKKFFISILALLEAKSVNHPEREVGIDLGIAQFATLSNGVIYTPLSVYKKYRIYAQKLEKQLKNKQLYSNNREKLKDKLAKLHSKMANCRKDFLHKLSDKLTKRYRQIYVEDLKINRMATSGNLLSKKELVDNKKELNKSIMDQAWYEFRRQLEYKSNWRGGKSIKVSSVNTSKECPICHFISSENRPYRGLFKCVRCHYSNNADIVGALNVLARGRILAKS